MSATSETLTLSKPAGAEQDRGHVRDPLPGQPALALAQPLVGMALRSSSASWNRRTRRSASASSLAELGDEHPVNPVVAERFFEQLFVVVHLLDKA